MSQRLYRFGNFSVDTGAHALLKEGTRIPIQEQPFQVLLALLENPGQVVTREALRIRLWGTDTFVDFDQSLNSALRRLRLALEDNSRDPVYVETIPRVGFRFLPEVEEASLASAPQMPALEDPAPALADFSEFPDPVEAPVPALATVHPVPEARERRFSAMAGSVALLTFVVGVLLGVAPAHWPRILRPQSVAASSRAEDSFSPPALLGRFLPAELAVGSGSASNAASMSELQGWYHLNQRTDQAYTQAEAAFEQTLAARPQSTTARVGLAQTEILIALNGNDSVGRLQRAHRLGLEALRLSPHLAAAHTVIGATDALTDWNSAEAEQEFRTALHLEPHDSLAHLWYAVFVLLPRQQYAQAENEALEAVREEPLSLIAHTDLGWILYSEGKHDAAMQQYQFVLDLNPNFVPAQFRMRQVKDAEGTLPPATARPSVRVVNAAAESTAVGGHEAGCSQAANRYTDHPDLDTLREGVVQHCPQFYFFGQNPELAKLKRDPAFLALLSQAHPAHPLP